MPYKPIVLGVDLDGVCADFYGQMREVAAEWFERPLDELTKEVSYGLKEWGVKDSDQYASMHRFAVTSRDLFREVPMIAGARRVLRSLSDEKIPDDDGEPKPKYRIRIITHRLFIHYFHSLAVQQTIDWLDYHGIPYWDLCFMKDKDQVGADIYIEDGPNNIEKLREGGHYTICFANSTNTHIEDPRANGWDEVYKLVKAQTPDA